MGSIKAAAGKCGRLDLSTQTAGENSDASALATQTSTLESFFIMCV